MLLQFKNHKMLSISNDHKSMERLNAGKINQSTLNHKASTVLSLLEKVKRATVVKRNGSPIDTEKYFAQQNINRTLTGTVVVGRAGRQFSRPERVGVGVRTSVPL